jgi:hypothetical protein
MQINAEVWFEESTNSTIFEWIVPWLTAFPENEAVEGWEWPDGATVTLTIDNAPGLEWQGVAAVTTWGDPRTYVRFDFTDLYDLQVGDVVTLTDNVTVSQHTVKMLSVTEVNANKDKIHGRAERNETVYVWPHEFDQVATVQVTAGKNGKWLADFAGLFDLVPGVAGRSQVLDEEGNATAVDWYTHPRYTGHWRAVDTVDQSNMHMIISGSSNNRYQLIWLDDYWSVCGGRPGIGHGMGTPDPGGFLRVDWVVKCRGAGDWQGQIDYWMDIVTRTLWDGSNTWYLVTGQ